MEDAKSSVPEIRCPRCNADVTAEAQHSTSVLCPDCGAQLQIIDSLAYIPGGAFMTDEQPEGKGSESNEADIDTPPPFRGEGQHELDPLYYDALRYLATCNAITIAMLARYFNIDDARAAQLMQQLEDNGAVAPFDGVHPRKILIEHNQQLPGILRRTLGNDPLNIAENTRVRSCSISLPGCGTILLIALIAWLIATLLK